ncbi:predicted protein [Plenodomus lingam JN3]|uniref:Predicted protein n=1 Tax=Leptosphaeria maculans (strain JN3 / isolate v23.1.3 / race Av1-4-5-6-7-8) TaxID=985895 RepID=E5AFC5_LEPMJ|nr:predicted protein [Plenodomus lingam JN3]CBY01914.1 predicted protein [Plenodomus lingam JN3]
MCGKNKQHLPGHRHSLPHSSGPVHRPSQSFTWKLGLASLFGIPYCTSRPYYHLATEPQGAGNHFEEREANSFI